MTQEYKNVKKKWRCKSKGSSLKGKREGNGKKKFVPMYIRINSYLPPYVHPCALICICILNNKAIHSNSCMWNINIACTLAVKSVALIWNII